MQESETRFDNMPMSAFKIPIMFKSVGRCSESRERIEGLKIHPIICVKCFNGGGKIIFNKLLENDKG